MHPNTNMNIYSKRNETNKNIMDSFWIRCGQFSWIVRFFLLPWDVISWMRRFSVSVKKINSFKDVFVEDVNSAGGRLPTNAKIILKIPQYFFKVDFSLLLKNILKSKEKQNQLFNDIFNFCYVYDNIFTIGLLQPHDLFE